MYCQDTQESQVMNILPIYSVLFGITITLSGSLISVQARDEEKNRRNNTNSTNEVMKDLEDLLPNRSLIPPPPPEPGQLTAAQLKNER